MRNPLIWRKSQVRPELHRIAALGIVALVGLAILTNLGTPLAGSPQLPAPQRIFEPVTYARSVPQIDPHPASGPVTPYWAEPCGDKGSTVPACVPQPMKEYAVGLAFDTLDGYAVEFGGSNSFTNGNGLTNNSWKWVGGAWSALAAGPSTLTARSNMSMVYDGTDNYVLMFGGYTAPQTYAGDTWKFTGGAWTRLFSSTAGFVARAGACTMYIPSFGGHGGYVLLFGGKSAGTTAGAWQSDTWEFSGGTWTNVTSTAGTAPTGRGGGMCFYDNTDHYGVMFGGESGASTFLNGTWEWNPTTSQWSNLIANGQSSVPSPSPRAYGAGSWNTYVGTDILMGGARGTVSALLTLPFDNWQWITGAWTNTTGTYNLNAAGPGSGMTGEGITDIPIYSYQLIVDGANTAVRNWTFELGAIMNFQGTSVNIGEVVASATQVIFYQNVSNGSGVFTYTWSGLPTGCSAANTSTITCTPTTAGVYFPSCVIHDTAGHIASPQAIKFVVDSSGQANGALALGTTIYSPPFGNPLGGDIWSNISTSIPQTVALTKATAINLLHFYGQWDKSNITSGYQGVLWSGGTSSASSTTNVQYNLTHYSSFCQQDGCSSFIGDVPFQTNDTGAAVAALSALLNRWNLPLKYVNLGTEVNNYNHWNIAFPNWRGSQNVAPTGFQYAYSYKHTLPYLQAVDPALKFTVQLSGGNSYNNSITSIAQNMSKLNCGNVTWISLDYYPNQGNQYNDQNLAAYFYNDSKIPARLNLIKTQVTAGNASCSGKIGAAFSENNPSGGGSWPQYEQTYPAAAFTVTQIVQALQNKVPQFSFWSLIQDTTFNSKANQFSMINASTLATDGEYTLYSKVLPSMYWNTIEWANDTTTQKQIFSVAGVDAQNDTSILLVNANTTVTNELTVTSLPQADTWKLTYYQPSGVTLVTYNASTMPSILGIAPQTILMIQLVPPPQGVANRPVCGGTTGVSCNPVTQRITVSNIVSTGIDTLGLALVVFGVIIMAVRNRPAGAAVFSVGVLTLISWNVVEFLQWVGPHL